MKLSPGEQESIVALLTRIYHDIRDIEEEFALLAGEGDFRPRIEYFHDAVRALSGRDPKEREEGGRLCIELLAYDLSCLRFLQAKPLSPFKPHGQTLSARTDLIDPTKSLTAKPRRPDRAMRERLTELYQHYAVLFAALLKPLADNDFYDRSDDLSQDMADLNSLMQELQAFLKDKGSIEALSEAVHHLEDASLRQKLTDFLHSRHMKRKESINKLLQQLTEERARKDKEAATIDAAHMNYAVSQLAIYENAKDMLKTLAGRGMNLVGKFVEASMAEARREMGR